ncbi:MAG: VanZ family protein [Nitrosopumilaceae archaeon]
MTTTFSYPNPTKTFILLFCVAAALALLPIPSWLNWYISNYNLDKVGHVLGYTALTFWYLTTATLSVTRMIGVMLLLAVGFEYAQLLVPVRSFNYYDMLSNVIGVIVGVIATFWALLYTIHELESERRHIADVE